jgi:hypothetical protein
VTAPSYRRRSACDPLLPFSLVPQASAAGGKRTGSFWVSKADKLPFVQADQDVGLAPSPVIESTSGDAQKRTPIQLTSLVLVPLTWRQSMSAPFNSPNLADKSTCRNGFTKRGRSGATPSTSA